MKHVGKSHSIVIGGGFYGCCLALMLKGSYDNVTVLEKEADILTRASALNQARVHTGFHYPRNLVTAYRSLINFPHFVLDFRKAIVNDFTKIYAIAKRGSKINAHSFFRIFKEMKAEIAPASKQYKKLFSKDLIEEVFEVREYAFNVDILREIIRSRLEKAGIIVRYNTTASKVIKSTTGIDIQLDNGGVLSAHSAFNCCYSLINFLLEQSGLPLVNLKHEVTEMALVSVPPILEKMGITVMDGPFFSLMPYPAKGCHTLSHVRYTPHFSWCDSGDSVINGHQMLKLAKFDSNYIYMKKDAQRYMPCLAEIKKRDSIFELKTVLIKNEINDGRPILFRIDHGIPNFGIVMGSKLDNIYDMLEMLAKVKTVIKDRSSAWKYL